MRAIDIEIEIEIEIEIATYRTFHSEGLVDPIACACVRACARVRVCVRVCARTRTRGRARFRIRFRRSRPWPDRPDDRRVCCSARRLSCVAMRCASARRLWVVACRDRRRRRRRRRRAFAGSVGGQKAVERREARGERREAHIVVDRRRCRHRWGCSRRCGRILGM